MKRDNVFQHLLDFSRSLRDAGIHQALDSAGDDWYGSATTLVLDYFEQVDDGLFEDARQYAESLGLPDPPTQNAWGALCMNIGRKKLLAKTGEYRQSVRPTSHARVAPVWRRA